MHSSSRSKKKTFSTRHPNAPKRFCSAFIFFSMERHDAIRKERLLERKGPTPLLTAEVAKIISKEWREMKPGRRSFYDEMSRQDRLRWQREKEAYNGPWRTTISSSCSTIQGAKRQGVKITKNKTKNKANLEKSFHGNRQMMMKKLERGDQHHNIFKNVSGTQIVVERRDEIEYKLSENSREERRTVHNEGFISHMGKDLNCDLSDDDDDRPSNAPIRRQLDKFS